MALENGNLSAADVAAVTNGNGDGSAMAMDHFGS